MKIKIKTYLWLGILMALLSVFLLVNITTQVRLPQFDSGAPSPRIIPGVCLSGILICSVLLIVQSVFFHKEKIYEFDLKRELPAIGLIGLMVLYVILNLFTGYIIGTIVMMAVILAVCKEKRPIPYLVIFFIGVAIFLAFTRIFYIFLPGFGG